MHQQSQSWTWGFNGLVLKPSVQDIANRCEVTRMQRKNRELAQTASSAATALLELEEKHSKLQLKLVALQKKMQKLKFRRSEELKINVNFLKELKTMVLQNNKLMCENKALVETNAKSCGAKKHLIQKLKRGFKKRKKLYTKKSKHYIQLQEYDTTDTKVFDNNVGKCSKRGK